LSALPDPRGAEIRRCLENLDVEGMMRVWKQMAPGLANQGPREALISMHMARCDMQTLPRKLKAYSRDWLAERGYRNIDGKWVAGLPPPVVVAEAVGIAVRSKYPEVAKRITTAMQDALENERAKGETDPLKQREAMHKARMKQRFKLRMA
jgi:hypothetical protein